MPAKIVGMDAKIQLQSSQMSRQDGLAEEGCGVGIFKRKEYGSRWSLCRSRDRLSNRHHETCLRPSIRRIHEAIRMLEGPTLGGDSRLAPRPLSIPHDSFVEHLPLWWAFADNDPSRRPRCRTFAEQPRSIRPEHDHFLPLGQRNQIRKSLVQRNCALDTLARLQDFLPSAGIIDRSKLLQDRTVLSIYGHNNERTRRSPRQIVLVQPNRVSASIL